MSPTAQIEQATADQVKQALDEQMAQQQATMGATAPVTGGLPPVNGPVQADTTAKTTASSSAGGPFSVLAQHPAAMNAYLEQYAHQFGILNYNAANKAYVDALYIANQLGVLDIAKDSIVPFPSNNKNITIVTGPQQSQVPQAPQAPQTQATAPADQSTAASVPVQATAPAATPAAPVSSGNGFNKILAGLAAAGVLGSGLGGGALLNKYLNPTPVVQQTTAPLPTPIATPSTATPATVTPDTTNGLSVEIY